MTQDHYTTLVTLYIVYYIVMNLLEETPVIQYFRLCYILYDYIVLSSNIILLHFCLVYRLVLHYTRGNLTSRNNNLLQTA